MKKLCALVALSLGLITANAQHQINSFFDDLGNVRLETTELDEAADTLVTVFHRKEDVVWARVVYSIIDMRMKQNYQLYFPTRSDDPRYKSLFKVILDAIADGMPIYEKSMDNIKPDFIQPPLDRQMVPTLTMIDDPLEDYSNEENRYNVETSDAMLLHYDSVTNVMTTHLYGYEDFVRNQLKYMVQEVIFFDRHTSRLYRKLIAIAPLHADKIVSFEPDMVMNAMLESILFWIPFDYLRPYLAKQYVITSENETKRITFEEYFQKRLYTSYLLGESNMYDRMILDYAKDEKEVKQEQARIERELLSFEQDLWEY